MKSQRLKDLYFSSLQPLAQVNAWRWRMANPWRHQTTPGVPRYVNLGCGAHYALGFINVEGNLFQKKDLWLDLRNRLPFADESVDAIYCCHVMEHFYLEELRGLLQECRRVLKKGGGIRILVPSLDQAIAAYVAGKIDWFSSFPTAYRSLGGKFFNFIFCASQHRLAFDFSFFQEILEDARFTAIVQKKPGDSAVFAQDLLKKAEPLNEPHIGPSLVVEAQR